MDTTVQDLVKEAHLRYTSAEQPGFFRSKKGKGFVYYDEEGKTIKNKAILERIEALGIPPAWEDVWICPLSFGHLQAMGIDEKGRKQYIYHQRWNEQTKQNKFSKMVDFSHVLPKIRSRVNRDMNRTNLSQERILATIVWLLDHTYIRIGNKEYAEENEHYGLTTLRNKHVDVKGETVTFDFVGKSGKAHRVGVTHPRVAKTIRRLEELPGYELFQYLDENGERHPVDSQEVNDYLKSLAKEDVTAKDFRTWGGTKLSAITLVKLGEYLTKVQLKQNLSAAVKEVANHLRNTTTVCRNYYIHPTIFTTYEDKILIPHFIAKLTKKITGLDTDEIKTALLIKKYTS